MHSIYCDLQVTIRVVDVNDNPPMFMPNIYYFTINENGTAPQLLGRVVATDRDEGMRIFMFS